MTDGAMGTTREISVEETQAGMKLERDVIGRKNRVLAYAGEVLTKKHVDQFNKWEKREKPLGPAIARPKDSPSWTKVNHEEFQGGYKLSHFQPDGKISISRTLASGQIAPDVERDPTKSPLFQNRDTNPRKSFAMSPNLNIESPLLREMQEKVTKLELENIKLKMNQPKPKRKYTRRVNIA